MTTPERLRRRQLIEGIIVLLLAIFTTLQAVYFTQQDREQRECLARTVQEITEVNQVRSSLNVRLDQAEQKALLAAGELLGTNPGDPDHASKRAKLASDLDAYAEEAAAVEQARKDNPVPTYPEGRCDD